MNLNRREFLLATAAALSGGALVAAAGPSANDVDSGSVDVGPATDFGTDGVCSTFRYQGIFVICRNGKVTALSSQCTHRKCVLNTAADGSFVCKCHGSMFDPDGKVTKGPARTDLALLQVTTTNNGHLLVSKAKP